jgi:alpha-glucosidase (family GH31 glycosyl hydrolase)
MYMKRNEDGTYQPGVIYELRCKIEDAWHPFYVGETINKATRLGQHQVSAKHANDESTLVYRFIHDYLDANNIEWSLFEVDQYDEQGPEALEDEHIMILLVEGVSLKNSKKGNANWMTERMAVADDMRKREITSYSLYKQVLTYEEQQRKVDEANAIRVAQELEQQRVLTKQEQIRQQMIEQAQHFAELARVKLAQENAARLAREEEKRLAWEADAPARELRLKIEAERLQAEELVREQRLAKVDANIAQHEEKQKIVREQQHEVLLGAQARMAKILERIQK